MLTRITRFALVGVFACAIAGYGTAYAQPDDDDDTEAVEEEGGDGDMGDEAAEGEGEAEAEPEGEGEAEAEATGGDDDAAMGAYPQAIVHRPLTLPKGAFEVAGTLTANKDFDAFMMGIFARYAISDKMQAGIKYGFMLKEFEIKGALMLHAGMSVMKNDKLEVLAGGQLGYDLLAEGIAPLSLGADVKFKLNDKIALFAYGNQLVVYLEGDVKPIFLQLPVGAGFQVNDKIWAQLTTNLGQIEIADSATMWIFADSTPVNLMGYFSPNNTLDVGVGVATDVTPPVGDAMDFLTIMVQGVYRGGL